MGGREPSVLSRVPCPLDEDGICMCTRLQHHGRGDGLMVDVPVLKDLLMSGHVLVYDDHRGWSLYEHNGLDTLGDCVLSRRNLKAVTRDAPGVLALYEEGEDG